MTRRIRTSLVAVGVFAVVALALSPDLGGQYVWSKDEARDGLVARDMVETGNWLIPHVGGLVYPYKPPLFHWLVALVSPGGVTEWSLRLPSVLAAAGTVALTYAMGARLGSPATGLAAAAVLASSATFVEWARTGRLEMLLVFWLTLGLWGGMRWLDEGERRHAVLLGLALGLGCLTKGPIGLAPLGTVIVARTLRAPWSARALADCGLALALSVAMLGAWLGLAAMAHPGIDDYLRAVIANFGDEVRTLRHQHRLFAGEALGIGFLPWTVVVPGASFVLLRRWRTSWRALLVPLLWIALVLVVFTVVMSPRAVYFLPIYPVLALVVAWAWAAGTAAERRWMLYPLGFVVLAAVILGLGLATRPLAITSARQLTVLGREFGLMAALIAGAAGFGAIALLRRARIMAVPVVVGVAALCLLVLLHVTVDTPRVNSAYPTRETAARFAALLPPGAAVAYVDVKLSTALMFYLPRRSVRLPQIRAVADLPDRAWRHALIPHEEMMLLVRKQCGLPPPLREETLAGDRYVLVNLDGVGPLCIKARPTATDR